MFELVAQEECADATWRLWACKQRGGNAAQLFQLFLKDATQFGRRIRKVKNDRLNVERDWHWIVADRLGAHGAEQLDVPISRTQFSDCQDEADLGSEPKIVGMR